MQQHWPALLNGRSDQPGLKRWIGRIRRQRVSQPLGVGRVQFIDAPKLIVADEPVSMVDASLRMSIVNLFRDLRDNLGVSIIYITHDLSTAFYISDRVIIMNKGEVVEGDDAQSVLGNPHHEYSRALRSAVLPPDPVAARAIIMSKISSAEPAATV